MAENRLFLKSYLAVCAIIIPVFIYLPLIFWSKSQILLETNLKQATLQFFFLAIFCLALAGGLAFAISKKGLKKILPFLIVLGPVIYILQNVLVPQTGILDGRTLDLPLFSTSVFIDLILVFVALFAAFRFKDIILKKGAGLSMLTLLAGAGLVGLQVAQHNPKPDGQSGQLVETDKFNLSAEKNIILFVLDGFQTDLFLEELSERPETLQSFEGFTFYPNMLAGFAKTSPSVPLILTGKTYKKEQPIPDFTTAAFRGSFLEEMQKLGWDIHLYPFSKSMISVNSAYLDNVIVDELTSSAWSDYLDMLDLSIFRSVPGPLKNLTYNSGEFLFGGSKDNGISQEKTGPAKTGKLKRLSKHKNLNFLMQSRVHTKASLQNPAFKFYHLMIPHAPFTLNRDLEIVPHEGGLENYREHARGGLALMSQYLDMLKEKGLYDQSMIIVTSDHGGGEYTTKQYNVTKRAYERAGKFPSAKSAGKALLLVKGFGDSGVLQTSNIGTMTADIAPTIAAAAGLNTRAYDGLPISEISPNEIRTREFSYYKFTGFDSRYLDDFTQFKVKGNVFVEDDWSRIGTLQSNIKENEPKSYTFGTTIGFGSDPKIGIKMYNSFLPSEIDTSQKRYAVIPRTGVKIPFNIDKKAIESQKNIRLRLTLAASGDSTTVKLLLNGRELKASKLYNRKLRQYIYDLPTADGVIKRKSILEIRPLDPMNESEILLSTFRLDFADPNITNTENKTAIDNTNSEISVVYQFPSEITDLRIPRGIKIVENETGYRITGTVADPKPSGKTGGVAARLPKIFEDSFSGNLIEVKIIAKGEQGNNFMVAYSTHEVGHSGWRVFPLTESFSTFKFQYKVNPKKKGGGDFLGVLPLDGSVDIKSINVSLLKNNP